MFNEALCMHGYVKLNDFNQLLFLLRLNEVCRMFLFHASVKLRCIREVCRGCIIRQMCVCLF